MKKVIALILSLVVLVACFAIARWAEGNTKVNTPTTQVPTEKPTTTGTAPTTQTDTEPVAPTNPDDIENGLGWG